MHHTRPIRQFHTLKHFRTGFLVETHHVLFVYLTLQRELLSELCICERTLALVKTLNHPIPFTSGIETKRLLGHRGVRSLVALGRFCSRTRCLFATR
jgi:hypothetical protein